MKLSIALSVLAALTLAGWSLAEPQSKLGSKDSTQMAASDLNRIKVGDEAPDFTLEDQDGKPVTLSSFRGKKSVVLVFYRGSW